MRLLRWLSKRNPTPPDRDPVRILVLSRSGEDRATLERLGNQHAWSVCFAASLDEAGQCLAREPFRIVLCDRDLCDGGDLCDHAQDNHPWREVLDRLVASCPDGCIFLLSRVNDGYLWREVVQRGGYDVLTTPLKEKSVIQAIHSVKRFMPAIQSRHH